MSYAEFRQARYFPAIDGLRAVSVFMVLAFHSADPIWHRLNGHLGVPIFFVISGFLITTLLLREERKAGNIDLKAFYLRRTFRIFPLYYLALAVFTFLTVGMHLGSRPETFLGRIPWFLTYNGEFAGAGTFSHGWSLGIEEKFYLVWPALAFLAAPLVRCRAQIVVVLLTASIATAAIPGADYLAIYAPILAGCSLALLMHSERGYRIAARLASWPMSIPLAATALFLLATNSKDEWQNVPFGMAAALLFPTMVIGPRWVRWLLSVTWARYVGTLAYGIYLFHPILISIVDEALPTDISTGRQLARMALIGVSSVAVAAILHRFFEMPMIRLGRRVACRMLRRGAGVEVVPQRAVTDDGGDTAGLAGVGVVGHRVGGELQVVDVAFEGERLRGDHAAGSDGDVLRAHGQGSGRCRAQRFSRWHGRSCSRRPTTRW
jgi:peptidoglycan/LPS O-acetylase OafA/YrhL